jgi:hypothetical protein
MYHVFLSDGRVVLGYRYPLSDNVDDYGADKTHYIRCDTGKQSGVIYVHVAPENEIVVTSTALECAMNFAIKLEAERMVDLLKTVGVESAVEFIP